MLYSVVGGNQVRALIHRVRQTDPHAFVNVMRTDQVAAGSTGPPGIKTRGRPPE